MVRLRPVGPKEAERRLLALGFVFSHWKGGHKYFKRIKDGKEYITFVPQHSKDIWGKSLASTLRRGGITKDEFFGVKI